MKKTAFSLVLAMLFSTTLYAKNAHQTETKFNNTIQEKTKYLPEKKVIELLKLMPDSSKIINDYKNKKVNIYVEEKDGFYVIMIKGERRGQFYITKDKKYAIFGTVVDLKKKAPVMGTAPINKKVIEDGVAFSYGSGRETIYLVTDPQCPYCRMLENKKGDKLLEKYKIKVILYPLPFHQYAKPMTEYILAGKNDADKAARLRRILQGSNEWKNFKPTDRQKKEINKKLEKMQKAVNELGARGTPTIYTDKFKQIPLRKIYEEK
ncbi:DsbC family protein [Caminibacter sp.]